MTQLKKRPGYLLLSLTPVIMAIIGQIVTIGTLSIGLAFLSVSQEQLTAILEDAMLLTTLCNIALFVLFIIWYRFGFVREEYVRHVTALQALPWLLVLGFGLFLISNGVLMAEGILFPEQMEEYIALMEESGLGDLTLLSAFTTLVAAPITEELIFRGVTLKILKKSNLPFFLLNLIQGVIFGIYHMNLIQGIYAALLGIVLGYVCELCHSLPAAVLLHSIFNFCGTFLVELCNRIGFSDAFYLILTPLGILLMFLSLRAIKNKKEDPEEEILRTYMN